MAATPQYGTMTFMGVLSKQTYTKDVYLSDVAGRQINFDSGDGASANSGTSWRPPEPVVLRDFSINTGMADTVGIVMTANGVLQGTGSFLRYANQLNTLNNRPALNIPFQVGVDVGAIQKA